jgi:diguanylate cyclase (GGDEF)-like protein/PAS domain S-box-containing protein
MAQGFSLLQAITDALDGLGIATCTFDDEDRAILWNCSFIELFPEHASHVHVGEPYRDNLRRFYQSRLSPDEMHAIEQYIEDGIARHRAQQRPFTFEHRGELLWANAVTLPGIGRMRIWRADPNRNQPAGSLTAPSGLSSLAIDSTTLFDYVADGVMVTSPAGRIVFVNRPFVVMYRFTNRTDATGITLEDAYRNAWAGLEKTNLDVFTKGLSRLTENQRFSGAPFEIPLPNEHYSLVTEKRSEDGNGYFLHVDITSLKRQQHQLTLTEQRLRESEALLKATLERMEQGIVMINAERIVEVCNRRAIELLGLPAELMASRPTLDEVFAYQNAINEFADEPESAGDFLGEVSMLDQPHRYDRGRPNGRVIEVDSVPIAGGGVLRTYTDITERKKHEERIHHIARHDALTTLVTRRVFLDCLDEAIDVAQRRGQMFAVHYLDFDRFKPINDQFGHPVGDEALALLAKRMRSLARESDVVGRLGGDEFGILQPHVERHDGALRLARRLIEGVSQPFNVQGHDIQLSASVGIALYPAAGTDATTLLRHADAAMYKAKAAGRNGVHLFDAEQPPSMGKSS